MARGGADSSAITPAAGLSYPPAPGTSALSSTAEDDSGTGETSTPDTQPRPDSADPADSTPDPADSTPDPADATPDPSAAADVDPTSVPADAYPYILFYDYTPSASNPVSLACFSQWYAAAFLDPNYPGVPFRTAEHYMMYAKALLFEPCAARGIVDAPTPAEAKRLGRAVQGFDRAVWAEHADKVVERGNYLKFSQDERLKRWLVETKGSVLVEASEDDRVWGIGFGMDTARGNEDKWGQNRMGLALTRARDQIIAEAEGAHVM